MDAAGNMQWDLPTIRFPGQYYDEETGLHYNRFRYYDPSIGRYISADPIGQAGALAIAGVATSSRSPGFSTTLFPQRPLVARGDINLYGYGLNRPTGLVDPTGEFGLVGAGIGAVSGGIGAAITSGGDLGAIATGAAVGAAVGAFNPFASSAAGAAAGAAVASAAGQVAGNLTQGNDAFCNFSPGAVAGAAVGGGLGAATNLVGGAGGVVAST